MSQKMRAPTLLILLSVTCLTSACVTNQSNVSPVEALKSKIESCWERPEDVRTALKSRERFVPVQVNLNFARDGSLLSVQTVNNPNKGPMGNRLGQVIVQGLKACAPYQIIKDNPELYNIVNPLQLTFHIDRKPEM